jgi:predicted porin
MQKKLIAVAVGGALASISAAPALAQNATVNVYGTMYAEYAWINNGAVPGNPQQPYQSYDHFQNPGSELGFRGEEKLGGGLSVWFQCATTLDYRGPGSSSSVNSQAGGNWCSRNSAVGIKGNFGNAFYGNWQTPWTRINSAANTGSNDTGVFGNAHIISGTSSTFGIQSPSQATLSTLSPAVYRRRHTEFRRFPGDGCHDHT